jgi:hypothetical protein
VSDWSHEYRDLIDREDSFRRLVDARKDKPQKTRWFRGAEFEEESESKMNDMNSEQQIEDAVSRSMSRIDAAKAKAKADEELQIQQEREAQQHHETRTSINPGDTVRRGTNGRIVGVVDSVYEVDGVWLANVVDRDSINAIWQLDGLVRVLPSELRKIEEEKDRMVPRHDVESPAAPSEALPAVVQPEPSPAVKPSPTTLERLCAYCERLFSIRQKEIEDMLIELEVNGNIRHLTPQNVEVIDHVLAFVRNEVALEVRRQGSK